MENPAEDPAAHGVDRRAFPVVLAGAALAGAGDPVTWQPGDPHTLCQLERLAANLACAYDAVGPSRAGAYARHLEAEAAGLASRLRRGPARQSAQAIQARLLAVSATAAAAAVDREQHRPSAWVVRRLKALDRRERRACGAGVFGPPLDRAEAFLAQAVSREPATGKRTTGGEHASV